MEPIVVDAFLADHVVESGHKLYANGVGWNIMRVKQLPGPLPPMGIGVLIHVPYTSTNEKHRFGVRLEGADGETIPLRTGEGDAIGVEFNVGRPADLQPGDDQIVPLAINLIGVQIEATGAYMFRLSIDGDDARSLRFRVTGG